MSIRQDNIRRRSFSYKMKRWFWSNHKNEIQTVIYLICEFALAIAFFGMIFVLPHIFH
jgi:hypothetical protein